MDLRIAVRRPRLVSTAPVRTRRPGARTTRWRRCSDRPRTAAHSTRRSRTGNRTRTGRRSSDTRLPTWRHERLVKRALLGGGAIERDAGEHEVVMGTCCWAWRLQVSKPTCAARLFACLFVARAPSRCEEGCGDALLIFNRITLYRISDCKGCLAQDLENRIYLYKGTDFGNHKRKTESQVAIW